MSIDKNADHHGDTWPTHKAKEKQRRKNRRISQTRSEAQQRAIGITPPPAWIRPRRDPNAPAR